MRDVDTHWIVRQMIGSDAKDFAKADDHAPGDEIFRAEDICLPRATGGLAVDHVSLSLRAGEILGIYGLMGAGRSELFDCIMGRHRPCDRQDLHRRRGGARARHRRGRIRARPGADSGGPPARRAGVDPVGRQQSDARQPGALHAVLPHPRRRRERQRGRHDGQRAVDQGCRPGAGGLVAVRRKPAEGGDRQGAADRARRCC